MGIGAATAVELARQGARVAVHYNSSREAAEAVAGKIADLGGEAKLFQADLSDAAEARALVPKVLAELGRIDTLVNNAGSLVDRKMFLEIDDEFWTKVMDINVTSVVWIEKGASHASKAIVTSSPLKRI